MNWLVSLALCTFSPAVHFFGSQIISVQLPEKSTRYKLPGRSVMRRIILGILLAAGVMYVILHCNVWRTNSYWMPSTDVERKAQLMPCTFKPSTSTFTNLDIVYPFLCSHNFLDMSELHESFNFELPYGIRGAEKFFQMALSRLNKCGLFPEDESSPPCKKCVVVGNGGVLRNKSLGETIDSYDVVIRMNNGPVVGYEQDVGRKTTYRLFYPESVFSDPLHYDPNTTAVLIVFKPYDLKWLWDLLSGHHLIKISAFWKKPALQLIYKPHQIRILDPAITRKTAHDLLHLPTKFAKHERPKHPTTGLIAIAFAFQICSEVHLAGFKYNLHDRNSSLHYYGSDTMSQMIQNIYHDIAVEQRFLKELIDHRILINLTEE
ncbi:type 2 lactosamine alpha-2,3-sialyltransferase isoform X3 [Sceloporus undulatus]|uniref:type 2 lactosamine alpha-2,3-sialyltransferase isoform X3 n=1 Tax=Sceloporus undulatus TaxID=8520 RepID=UPI001C4DA9B9|nr:type 2 lactosamine alpha-2,3-sialyltransferase isoform X3 [Sceloporus undulatus]